MKQTLQTEEIGQAAAGIAGLYFLPIHLSWWIWLLLFFSPDISMAGYAINRKVGAICYNIFHHKGLALVLAMTGFIIENNWLLLAGVLLFAHASFDRIFGYGLKYPDHFKHTHLGWIGKQ